MQLLSRQLPATFKWVGCLHEEAHRATLHDQQHEFNAEAVATEKIQQSDKHGCHAETEYHHLQRIIPLAASTLFVARSRHHCNQLAHC